MIGFLLVSCNNEVEDDTAIVYYYEYRNAYKQDKFNPDKIKREVHDKGKTFEAPADPTRSGYIFSGWYKDVSHQEEWNFDKDVLEKNMTLYAKWDFAIFKVNLEFNGGAFAENSSFNGEYDEDGNAYYLYKSGTTQALHSAVRTGYKFLGWHKTNSYRHGDKRLTQVERTLAEDTTYYAHWDLKRIIVRFNANLETAEPSEVDMRILDYGSIVDFPELTDTSGLYEFVGWNTRRDGSGDFITNGDPFTREVTTTLYAHWVEK